MCSAGAVLLAAFLKRKAFRRVSAEKASLETDESAPTWLLVDLKQPRAPLESKTCVSILAAAVVEVGSTGRIGEQMSRDVPKRPSGMLQRSLTLWTDVLE